MLQKIQKKLKFVLICVENSATFNFFFKLYSKNVAAEVISKKHEGYEKKVNDLKAEGKIVIKIGTDTTQEDFDNSLEIFFQEFK